GVTSNDGLLCSIPTAWHCRTEGSALTHFVFNSFVEHHEGVSGGADTNDQTGHTREIKRVADPATEEHQSAVDQGEGCAQGHHGDHAEESVVHQRVQRHQQDAY